MFEDKTHHTQTGRENLNQRHSAICSIGPPSTMLFHDVTFRFKISSSTIPAQFRAMLTSGMQEEIQGEVLIEDCDVDVMQALVNFLYTETLTGHEGVQKDHLLVAVAPLVSLCEDALCSDITSDNAIHLYQLAKSCGADKLRNAHWDTLPHILSALPMFLTRVYLLHHHHHHRQHQLAPTLTSSPPPRLIPNQKEKETAERGAKLG